ncbi:hypothetical protein FOQG_17562 [Fusarium oxysporum f. sp. raphani 54005]|uniref:Uncharacterized protein n=2 Tax=Fusarium oxysporum f. sp. raphani TaxID=96318 RepID=X0C4S2_FUSOX|nr:hypothetical protein FOQG_17562 [Fusarium oxysporum f. sp. raphani 54005]KAG7405760.1 hypothetical protein Forpi1262_v018323 [Fusarium oxysporum f. sp. raphani]
MAGFGLDSSVIGSSDSKGKLSSKAPSPSLGPASSKPSRQTAVFKDTPSVPSVPTQSTEVLSSLRSDDRISTEIPARIIVGGFGIQ